MNKQSLYIQNPLVFEFDAIVQECLPLSDDRFGIILDHTYFSPTGGGQEHDHGMLGLIPVIDIIKRDEKTLHVLNAPLELGRVHAVIDKDMRIRNMQHHSAQHLLTQCFIRLFDIETVSANINGYTPSALDLAINEIQKSQLERSEELANQIIFENRTIKSYFVTYEEALGLPLRKDPSVMDEIRIVEIDGFDFSACGGTHCQQTGMIGMIKILKSERVNEKIRVHFLAGLQALDYLNRYHEMITTLSSQLGVNPLELITTIDHQREALDTSEKELRSLKVEKLNLQAEQIWQKAELIGANRVIQVIFDDKSISDVRILVDELKRKPGLLASLGVYDGQKITLFDICTQNVFVKANELLERQLQIFNGRGGGDDRIAQGGGAISRDQAEQLLATSHEIIKEMLQA